MTPAVLNEGETLKESFTPDAKTYWRGHVIMALVLGLAAGAVLLYRGDPWPIMGPVGAVLAIGIRAFYLKSEALADIWHLTDRRLIGPRGITLPLSSIKQARAAFGAVQITMASGERHLMKYMADPAAIAERLSKRAI